MDITNQLEAMEKQLESTEKSEKDTKNLKKTMTLSFHNLSYKPKTHRKDDENILKNVNGEFKSGRLSAIIGPSGSGKTTLLNVLSGFKEIGVHGEILLNDKERQICEFRKISSYIPQEFAMLEQLTVLETLQISADLKLGFKVKRSIKFGIIQDILQILNLDKSKNTLVSRLSGGEKKRLSIGVELVTNPPILFLDEPTSGLDSVSSFQVLNYLKKLAVDGRTIICVVHQPSSRLLELFDDVLVMSEGECIYNGPVEDIVKTFAKAGFYCPHYYNRADYAIEVASKEHGDDLFRLVSLNNQKFNRLETIVIAENEADEKDKMLNGDVVRNNLSQSVKEAVCYKEYPVNGFEQFTILTKRSLLTMYRDLMCVQLRILAHIIVGVLLGIVFWKINSDMSTVLSNNSCLFFFILFLFFANAMPAVLSCPLETAVMLREHLNSWYSVEAYYFAKFISDLPLQFLCSTIFCGIAYFMTGQSHEFGRFLMFWGIALLTSFLGQSVGLFAGSAFNMKMAVFLVPASCIPMLIFSGFFIRSDDLSRYLRPLLKISYFRYSLEGFLQSIYGYNRYDLSCHQAYCQFSRPYRFLRWNDIYYDSYGIDVLALSIWILFIQLCLYISLKVKVKMAK